MPNPTTITSRQHDELDAYRSQASNLGISKQGREEALRNISRLEIELDVPKAERTPNVNGRPVADPSRVAHRYTLTEGERALVLKAVSEVLTTEYFTKQRLIELFAD